MIQAANHSSSETITPFLWFNDQAEEAMQLYTSLFKHSRIVAVNRAGDRVMSGTFVMDGRTYHAFNGGPHFQFNEAISLMITCDTQEEIDRYWNALTADGGQESRCGWLKDRFGLSWQVVPRIIEKHLNDKDQGKTNRVMKAVMGMVKLDIAEIEKAYKEAA